MNTAYIINFLRNYNEWRRGEDAEGNETMLEQPSPREIGRVIDAACTELEALRDLRVAYEQNSQQCVQLNRDLKRATDAMGSEFTRSDFELAAAAKRESELRSDLTRVADELKAAKDWILNDSKTIGQLRADLASVTEENARLLVANGKLFDERNKALDELADLRSVNRYQRGHSEGYKEAEEELTGLRRSVTQWSDEAKALRARVEAATPAKHPDTVRGWNTGDPDVPVGAMRRLWCAVLADNGKTYHSVLCYANGYAMQLADWVDEIPDCCKPIPGDEDNLAWFGWYEESCDHCETQWHSSANVIAWMELPKFDSAMEARHD